ncbi:helix-turn-helix transcriptional regulator [Clostridium phage CWou-2020a]|nr:helix-turn-helix transcriptional regulator [Clostridium botulinum]QPW59439.1 helix-turn-helix transcriptional regulator [Clostridium phage CWou-2020a]MCD3211028.1 helix-turn-helix transcriptional regulator [Clostridium botulinum C/D]MCD3240893.1 helix-turn-helix transcriptional regulator [Clostridium botulinum D/C]MCD3259847.1 helix-turn-helix transcriptional regulator [Clostridium botulinum C/D]MCD3264957.1 helix-turn-helix transcriptional regulator [Clostridium botulinum C/D]
MNKIKDKEMIHKRISQIRRDNKLNQSEFGKKLGVSRDVVSNMENSRGNLKQLFLDHLCTVFNVNKTWLLTGEGEMYIVDDEAILGSALADIAAGNVSLQNIAKKLVKLDDEYLNLVEHLVNTLYESEKKKD